MDVDNNVINYLSVRLRGFFAGWENISDIREIRLRTGRAMIVCMSGGESIATKDGMPVIVWKEDIKETLEYISNYSLYAYEEEIKKGFITMNGGNRVGLCGRVVYEAGSIKTIRNICAVNIRMAHQIRGCSDMIMDKLYESTGKDIYNTLIVSAPCCGKTTLLRDIVRNISDGFMGHAGMTVGIADERSEIAACNMGVPQNDVGMRTDVLDGCMKSQGMMMLIRSMSPGVVAVDEIGSDDDVQAIRYAVNCGCRIIATVHATSMEELYHKIPLKPLLGEKVFGRIILLGNREHIGSITGIYDGEGNII